MTKDPAALSWYAVYANIRGEYRAQAGLRERGFDAYCPSLTRWIRHSRKKIEVIRPVLPRYVFVGMDRDCQSFHTIRQTDGVESLVGVCGAPVAIPYAWISGLRTAETLGEFDETKPKNQLVIEPGKPVRVIVGPFTGFVGRIIEARGPKRVTVLLQEMGRLAPGKLELDNAGLEAA